MKRARHMRAQDDWKDMFLRRSYRLACWSFLAALGTSGIVVARPFTPQDLLNLERVQELQLSPDEAHVAYVLATPHSESNDIGSHIEIVDSDGHGTRAVQGSVGSSSPRWSPDGKSLYFLSLQSGSMQVWRSALRGDAAVQVTDLPVDITSFKVSPDGRRLFVTMRIFADCADLDCTARRIRELRKSPVQLRTYDHLFIRHWKRWSDGRISHLFSLALGPDGRANAAPIDLTRSVKGNVPGEAIHHLGEEDQGYAISPDGSRVVFMSKDVDHEAWSTNFDLFEVDSEGREYPNNLTEDNRAWDAEPKFSPDGRWLAWKAMDREGNEADRFHLILKDLGTGQTRELAANWDRSVAHFEFSGDSRSILATADDLGRHPLWSVGLTTGQVRMLIPGGTVTEFSVGYRTLVYAMAGISSPADLYRSDLDGKSVQRLTQTNEARLAGIQMGQAEQFRYSGWNGEEVSGFVVKPANYDPGQRYPVALIVHGGPQSSLGDVWSYRWNPQIFSGAGFAVVMIDFHGSTGYGQAFTDSVTGDWGGKPLADLKLGLAAAEKRFPWLDSEKACALGASYGGYMMNWIEGAWPDQFRCIVSQSGVFDIRELYYGIDETWLLEYEFGGPEFANSASYEKHNPVKLVSNWRTPMLVGHGEIDFDVPYSQGIATFTALQRRGIPSRLFFFPDEGHWITKPGNALRWQNEMIAWLKRWLVEDCKFSEEDATACLLDGPEQAP